MKTGTKVKYYPIKGREKFKETVTTSEPFSMCGTLCCKVEGVRSCVDLDHLEEIK